MKFKIDENLPVDAARLFRASGHDALTVGDQNLRGAKDSIVSAVCVQEGRTLVTLDMGFSNIKAYPSNSHSGIIVIRATSQSKRHILDILEKAVSLLEKEPLTGKLWILEEGKVRIRN